MVNLVASASLVKGKRALLRAAPRGEPLHATPDNVQLLLVIVLHLHLHCFCFIKFFFLRSPSDPSNAKQYFQNPPMQWLPQELPGTPPPRGLAPFGAHRGFLSPRPSLRTPFPRPHVSVLLGLASVLQQHILTGTWHILTGTWHILARTLAGAPAAAAALRSSSQRKNAGTPDPAICSPARIQGKCFHGCGKGHV